MSTQLNTTVRMFGALHTIRKEKGLQSTTQVNIPPEGCTAVDLAHELDLPLDKIEAVFINHLVYPLDYIIKPGDRVALVPTGVPGPYRMMLNIYNANKKTKAAQEEGEN